MGLLDDAIREHLDLKRARGADPAEIERLEREALGPVRRDPGMGSGRLGAPEQSASGSYQAEYPGEPGFHNEPGFHPEPAFHDEPLTELDELQERGYHDSTAPHPHVHHEHPHAHAGPADDHLDFEAGRQESLSTPVEPPEQPKRRFLRRQRPEPRVELPDHDRASSDEPDHDLAPFDEESPDRYASDQVGLHDSAPSEFSAPPPPQLQFERPPERPRFNTEPPELHPHEEEPRPAAPAGEDVAGMEPRRLDTPEAPTSHDLGAQETTEFDVERHLAQSHHDEAAPHDASQGEASQDEDVLEETPEFLQDTPEHDRLWFEQRPPRDFDFDG